jgi:hypothetical protein
MDWPDLRGIKYLFYNLAGRGLSRQLQKLDLPTESDRCGWLSYFSSAMGEPKTGTRS